MKVRYSPDPERFCRMTTREVRESFLIDSLFLPNTIEMLYADVDRAIIGSAVPIDAPLALKAADELRADFFCQRRELGVLNIGQPGVITVDGQAYRMNNLDCLYVGRSSRDIQFASEDFKSPAKYYLLSYPAHRDFPTAQVQIEQAAPVQLGSSDGANKRTIYKCIHADGVQSCQLVMGFTVLEPGSVWNTMPPHTHERRMEVYMYFNVPEDARVFHYMGQPFETRHIVVADGQAVISPSWSIHAGVGTAAYTFCWGMGGENQAFDDMDVLTMDDIK